MNAQGQTSPLVIFAAWLAVSLPAAWGVYNTALNAAKLFSVSTPSTTVAVPSNAKTSPQR
jgi:hypothetical protein